MRFEFYHPGLHDVPKISVDGTVENAIHFSHWVGNETPAEVKADTSTEIALKLVASPRREQMTKGIQLVTNNHFDTDGVLSVWTVLKGERALEFREQLIAAAEAGDFSEFTNEAAVRSSIVIQGSDQAFPHDEEGSPLARQLAGEIVLDDARTYDLVLPEIESVMTRIDQYESLWRAPWERIVKAIESFERGASTVKEFDTGHVSLVCLAPEIFSSSGFDPTRHAAPYTAISRYAKGRIFVIATPVGSGWSYRIDYPYYSWAETVVRPRIQRHDLSELITRLNESDGKSEGDWKFDSSEMTSAVKFIRSEGVLGVSNLQPEFVSATLGAVITARTVGAADATAGYR